MLNLEHQIELLGRQIDAINSDEELRASKWRDVLSMEAEKKALEQKLASYEAEAKWHAEDEKRKHGGDESSGSRRELSQDQIDIQNQNTREQERRYQAAKEAAIDKACREIGLIP